ncbi:hypothetical protein Tco_1352155 [Tanacetum coccineum]
MELITLQDLFCSSSPLKINFYGLGPKRTKAPKRVYRGGNADWFDDVDSDGYFVIEVKDSDVLNMTKTDNVRDDNVREDNEGSFNNEYNDFEYGIEDRIDDVEVDMVKMIDEAEAERGKL